MQYFFNIIYKSGRLRPIVSTSAYVLNLLLPTTPRAQVSLQYAIEQLEQHPEADLGNGRVIAAFAKLVTNEGICTSQ